MSELQNSKVDSYLKKMTEGKELKIPDNTIDLGEQPNGERKYSFDKDAPNSMFKDRQLIDIARAYYYERDGTHYESDEEVVESFIDDRTWKQANAYSIGKELLYATSDAVSMDQKRRLKYLTEYWNNLPNFWQDGGRGYVDGLVSNFSKGIVDPTNLLGPGVASQVIKTVAKKGGTFALSKAVAAGTGAQAAVDAAIGSSVDATIQKTEMELGISQRFDLERNFQVAGLAAGVSLIPGLPTNYFYAKSKLANKNLDGSLDFVKRRYFDYADPVKKNSQALYGYKATVDDMVKQSKKVDKVLNDYVSENPKNPLAKKITDYFKDKPTKRGAFKLSTKEIKLLQKKDPEINPIFLQSPGESAYAALRFTAASSTRGESAIIPEGKVVLPVVADRNKAGKATNVIVKAGFEDSGVDPYVKIIDPVANKRLLETFNNYFEAKSSQSRRKLGKKTRMNTTDINAAIKKFNALKGEDRQILDVAFNKHKSLSDAMLELQRRNGLLSVEQVSKIKIDHPSYVPFYPKTRKAVEDTAKEISKIKKFTDKEIDKRYPTYIEGETPKISAGGKGPAQYKIVGSDKEIAPIHESMMNYIFHAYKASEKNAAKLKVYDEIDKLEIKTNGAIKASEIYQPVTKVKEIDAIKKSVIKALQKEAEDSGYKLNTNVFKNSLEGEDSIKVAAFKDSIEHKKGEVIDVVYKNGKLKMYKILDPGYVDMYKSLGGITNDYIRKLVYGNWGYGLKGKGGRGGFLGKVGFVSRIFPTLITHSPPFIAFNFIRDTLAGSINSAFGFNAYGFLPGLSTFEGLFRTFKAPKDMLDGVVKNVKSDGVFKGVIKGMKEAFYINDLYRQALNSGLGFAGRRDTERLITRLTTQIKNSPAKNKGAYLDSLNYIKNTVSNFGVDAGKGYASLVNRVEYASRLAEFTYAKKIGADDLVAAFAGREISTDFGMKGASANLNAYNRVTMFFNAGLQGFYRGVIRRPSENKGKFIAGVTATLVAPEILLWTLTNETPEYESLDEDIKLLNYVIPIYEDTKPDGTHLRADGTRKIKTFLLIPKPYDFGVFPNIARGILEALQEGSPEIVFKYAQHSIAKVLPGMSLPTLGAPIYDLIRNENYKGNAIQPYYKSKGVFRDQLVKTNTRFTAEMIADGINDIYKEVFSIKKARKELLVTPIGVDYILSNYFVGLAQYPLDIAEAKLAWDEEAFGKRPSPRLDEADISRSPLSIVTRRFFAKVPTKYNKKLSDLYDLKREAEKVVTTYETASQDLYTLFRNKLKIDVGSLTNEQIRSAMETSDMLAEGLITIKKLREKRNIIRLQKYNPGTGSIYTADEKRDRMNSLLQKENELANNLMRDLKESPDPYVFMSVFGNKTFKKYKEKNFKFKDWQKVVAGYFK